MSSEPDNKHVEQPAFQVETQDVYDEPTLDPIYQAKARILNDALQDIGMGKYQASPCLHFFPLSCTLPAITPRCALVWVINPAFA